MEKVYGVGITTCCQESDINFVKLQGDSIKRQDFFILSMYYSRTRKRLDTPSHAGSWGKEPSTWEERDNLFIHRAASVRVNESRA